MDDTQSQHPDTQGSAINLASQRRAREFAEIAVGFSLILLALWSAGWAQLASSCGAFFWILFVTIRSRAGIKRLGLRITGMRRAMWVVALATAAALMGVWVSVRLHTLHAVFRNFRVEWAFLAYIVWALLQQFILQDFFLARLTRIVPTRAAAVIIAGLLFALAHVPNPVLVIATLVWGIVACLLFLRYRNLYVLGLAHAILGMCLAVTIPNAVHHQMRVGLGYLQWHLPAATQVPRHEMHLGANVASHP
jgi:membrane protease YdiL (CAAX protease family)